MARPRRTWRPRCTWRTWRMPRLCKIRRRVLTMSMERLHHDVDELTRHDDDFTHRRGSDEFLHMGIGERRGAYRTLVGADEHRDMGPQLAVDLHHHGNRGGLQRRGIDGGPWLIDQRRAMTEGAPHGMSHVRDDRREPEHRDLQGLLHDAAILRGALRVLRQRIQ